MGNASSIPEEDSIGEQIFQFAEKCLGIDDIAKLEKITGMVVYSGASAEELKELIERDQNELERRLRESAESIIHEEKQSQSNTPSKDQNRSVEGQQPRVNQIESSSSKRPSSRSTQNNSSFPKKRDELIAHFERLYPTIDSRNVVDELLKLSEDEINHVVSSPAELKNFMTICMCSVEESEQGATSSKLDSFDSLEKLNLEHMEHMSKAELRDEDVQLLIGNHLFNRVNKLHPSKAECFTGVLMELDKDLILQLLVSAPKLHKNLAVIITEMNDRGTLKQG
eukprot:Seg1556.11 transcript_id=Seg1556.11/GoldUCD/mRNA.D3Y31 product="hypothetical protein" protein_id=Seg1556.11/GoldUCD/D3Y31